MKKMIMLLTLIAISNAFATVTIDGYVYVCDRCIQAVCGEVRVYSDSVGGTLIDSDCMSNNGYYSLEVREGATYYLEVYIASADPEGMGGPCYTNWFESEYRISVVVTTSDVSQDLCATVISSHTNTCTCY